MLTVDATTFVRADMDDAWLAYRQLAYLRQPQGIKYAICMRDPMDTVSLVLYLRQEGGSVLLIHGDTPEEAAVKAAVEAGCDYLLHGAAHNVTRVEESSGGERERERGTPGLYQFSSGTTGNAKQIRRSWDEVGVEIAAYNEALGDYAVRRPIVWASVSHAYGLISGVLASMERGQHPIVLSGRNPKHALRLLKEHPGHLLYAVPLLIHGLSGFLTEAHRPEAVMTSGAPMPAAMFERLSQAGTVMLQQYGCTELGCVTLAGPMTGADDLGRPLSHYRVVTTPANGNPGEIIVESAASSMRPVGTKDLGLLDAEGRLRFLSRMDDVINAGGLKIYPSEVEDVMTRMQGIEEAVVFRGNHPVMGETARALVVSDEAITPSQIRDWCLQALPPYKVPSDIVMVAAIPRTAGGKISRRMLELEEEYE
ncbi:AMP-binding protein [Paenibacillus sp. strain BS8-2]